DFLPLLIRLWGLLGNAVFVCDLGNGIEHKVTARIHHRVQDVFDCRGSEEFGSGGGRLGASTGQQQGSNRQTMKFHAAILSHGALKCVDAIVISDRPSYDPRIMRSAFGLSVE